MEDGPDVAACSANYARPMDDELTPKERTTRVGRLLALLLFATLVGGIVGAVIGYAVGEDCPPRRLSLFRRPQRHCDLRCHDRATSRPSWRLHPLAPDLGPILTA
jgi:hypothetical protein